MYASMPLPPLLPEEHLLIRQKFDNGICQICKGDANENDIVIYDTRRRRIYHPDCYDAVNESNGDTVSDPTPAPDVDEWREEVILLCTDALEYFTGDARRLWGRLNSLAEERPDAYEVVHLRDWLASAGAVFVSEVSLLQSSVVKK